MAAWTPKRAFPQAKTKADGMTRICITEWPHLFPGPQANWGVRYACYKALGADTAAVAGVRVNPLDGDGIDDLAAVMRGATQVRVGTALFGARTA